MHTHNDYLCAIDNATSLSDIKEILKAYTDFIGGDYFVYAAMTQIPMSAPDVIAITNYPEKWQSRYTQQGYFSVDPTIEHCARSLKPIYWDEIDYRENETAQRMMDDAISYGLASGVTIPQHAPNGLFSVTSFCSATPNDERLYSRLKSEQASIYSFCVFLHEMASKLIGINYDKNHTGTELTQRERECLMWSAEGKTAADIALILDISERTVTFHLNNAVKKLDASNRYQAIAKAIATGELRSSSKGVAISHHYKAYD